MSIFIFLIVIFCIILFFRIIMGILKIFFRGIKFAIQHWKGFLIFLGIIGLFVLWYFKKEAIIAGFNNFVLFWKTDSGVLIIILAALAACAFIAAKVYIYYKQIEHENVKKKKLEESLVSPDALVSAEEVEEEPARLLLKKMGGDNYDKF